MEGAFLQGLFRTVGARFTHALIRHGLRSQFRGIYLLEKTQPPSNRSAILFANHHYWWDVYLTYWLVCVHWGRSAIGWMEQARRFPPFGAVGALPFPSNDPLRRARVVRYTLERLRVHPSVLILFPEGRLHGGESLLPFERSLHWLAMRLPDTPLLPLAIHLVPKVHQYPCAYLMVGAPFHCDADEAEWLQQARHSLESLLQTLRAKVATPEGTEEFECILRGKLSAHERWCANG
jgi:1-acyl-sn-glycerol-3-phosphate acyltransferase